METVTRHVALEFRKPITAIGRWFSTVLGATMPETAVNKNHDSLAAKREIWTTRQRLVTPPPGDSMCPEYRGKPELCLLIPARTDTGHHLGALFFGKYVWHRLRPFYQEAEGKAPKAFMKKAPNSGVSPRSRRKAFGGFPLLTLSTS